MGIAWSYHSGEGDFTGLVAAIPYAEFLGLSLAGWNVLISLALWWVATEQAGISTSVRLRFVDASVDVGILQHIGRVRTNRLSQV